MFFKDSLRRDPWVRRAEPEFGQHDSILEACGLAVWGFQRFFAGSHRFSRYRYSAEGEGFEPPVPCSTLVFKTSAFDHSATPPGLCPRVHTHTAYFSTQSFLRCGEGGIRTHDELLTHTPLAGERLQPLGHLSQGSSIRDRH